MVTNSLAYPNGAILLREVGPGAARLCSNPAAKTIQLNGLGRVDRRAAKNATELRKPFNASLMTGFRYSPDSGTGRYIAENCSFGRKEELPG